MQTGHCCASASTFFFLKLFLSFLLLRSRLGKSPREPIRATAELSCDIGIRKGRQPESSEKCSSCLIQSHLSGPRREQARISNIALPFTPYRKSPPAPRRPATLFSLLLLPCKPLILRCSLEHQSRERARGGSVTDWGLSSCRRYTGAIQVRSLTMDRNARGARAVFPPFSLSYVLIARRWPRACVRLAPWMLWARLFLLPLGSLCECT